MKQLLAVLILVSSLSAHALQKEYKLITSSSNLTTSFTSAQLSGFNQITAVQVYNGSNNEIEVNCNVGSSTPDACTTGLCSSFHIAAGSTLSSPQNASLSGACWIRATSATATTGTIYVVGWGW